MKERKRLEMLFVAAVCLATWTALCGAQVSNVASSLGEVCSFPNGVLGVCEELSSCLSSGGVVKQNSSSIAVCQSSTAESVHVCCRKPHLVAKQMCDVWTQYWSSVSALPNHTCISEKPLIFGGEEAILGEFPNMVSIGVRNDDDSIKWQCGGCLITPLFVLTAAHCITRTTGLVVMLGEHDRSVTGEGVLPRLNFGMPEGLAGADLIGGSSANFGAIEQFIDVEKVYIYPEYQRQYHDIALLRLQSPSVLTTRVLPACLPMSATQHFHRESAFVVAGWGATEDDSIGGSSNKLLKVKIDFIEPNECWRRFSANRHYRPPWGITTDIICAGAENKDSCPGDSGGPLMQDSDLPRLRGQCMPRLAVGVVSFGPQCGQLGAYTRVASYLDWITGIVAPGALGTQ